MKVLQRKHVSVDSKRLMKPMVQSPKFKMSEICRECKVSDMRPMISPCRCYGGQSYVHVDCLDKIRNVSEESSVRCGQCNFKYVFHPEIELTLSQRAVHYGNILSRVIIGFTIMQVILLGVTHLLMRWFPEGLHLLSLLDDLKASEDDDFVADSASLEVDNIILMEEPPSFWYYYMCAIFFCCAFLGLLSCMGVIGNDDDDNLECCNRRGGGCNLCCGQNNCRANDCNCRGSLGGPMLFVCLAVFAILGFGRGVLLGIKYIRKIIREQLALLERQRFAKTHIVMDLAALETPLLSLLAQHLPVRELAVLVASYVHG